MEYMVAVFRARSQTISFASILKSYNIPCQVVNTPRIINVSCGVSAKFSKEHLSVVKQILARRTFDTFGGIYSLGPNGLNQRATRIF